MNGRVNGLLRRIVSLLSWVVTYRAEQRLMLWLLERVLDEGYAIVARDRVRYEGDPHNLERVEVLKAGLDKEQRVAAERRLALYGAP